MGHKVSIGSGKLIIEITGLEILGSLRHRIEIPFSHIKSVSTQDLSWGDLMKSIKIVGSRIPREVIEGKFLDMKGNKIFALIRHTNK
ncbi:MAG: hypothetical protein ACP5I6_07985 [Caldisphaera sp.]|jgi:hypothetical protein|nr:hypothetical protein [Caldisphaera sp.]